MKPVPTYDIHDLIEFLVTHPEKKFNYEFTMNSENVDPCLMMQFFKWKHKDAITVNYRGDTAWSRTNKIVAEFKFPKEIELGNIHIDCTTSQEILEKISHYGWL